MRRDALFILSSERSILMKTCGLCNRKAENLRIIAAGRLGEDGLLSIVPIRGVCDDCFEGFEAMLKKFVFDIDKKRKVYCPGCGHELKD